MAATSAPIHYLKQPIRCKLAAAQIDINGRSGSSRAFRQDDVKRAAPFGVHGARQRRFAVDAVASREMLDRAASI